MLFRSTTTPTPTTPNPDPDPTNPNPGTDGGNEQEPPQPTDISSEGSDRTGSIFESFRTFSEPIGKALRKLAETKNIEYTAPTVVFGVFFGYGLLLAVAGYREARNAQILAAILKREKSIAGEKNEFINLLSHHLRTPITIISGMIDLISFTQKDRDVTALKNMSGHIQQDVEAILGTTEHEVESIKPSDESTPRSI